MIAIKGASIKDNQIILKTDDDTFKFKFSSLRIIYFDGTELQIVIDDPECFCNFFMSGDKNYLMNLCDVLYSELPNDMKLIFRRKANPFYVGDRFEKG